MDVAQLREIASSGRALEYVLFWGPGDADEPPGPSCLSQWHPSPFEVQGCRYATAEHYMMAAKARLFGDGERLEQILASADPGRAKALGRQVRGFDGATWGRHRSEIVIRGNVAKFRSSPELLAYLLGTGDAVLVEASPYDRIWGVGLGEEDPRARDPLQWRGQNLLGFALMAVRERLRGGR